MDFRYYRGTKKERQSRERGNEMAKSNDARQDTRMCSSMYGISKTTPGQSFWAEREIEIAGLGWARLGLNGPGTSGCPGNYAGTEYS